MKQLSLPFPVTPSVADILPIAPLALQGAHYALQETIDMLYQLDPDILDLQALQAGSRAIHEALDHLDGMIARIEAAITPAP